MRGAKASNPMLYLSTARGRIYTKASEEKHGIDVVEQTRYSIKKQGFIPYAQYDNELEFSISQHTSLRKQKPPAWQYLDVSQEASESFQTF